MQKPDAPLPAKASCFRQLHVRVALLVAVVFTLTILLAKKDFRTALDIGSLKLIRRNDSEAKPATPEFLGKRPLLNANRSESLVAPAYAPAADSRSESTDAFVNASLAAGEAAQEPGPGPKPKLEAFLTLPYTMASIERFALENSLDVYMVLQRGQKRGSSWLTYAANFYGSEAEDKIIRKLRSMRGASDGVQIREIIDVSDGSCTEYRKSFQSRQKVLKYSDCKEHASNSQIRWLRTCFDRVLASGVQYGRIVRTRPDVALFRDVRLSSYPCGKVYVPYKSDPSPVAGDWFFFMDFTLLKSWWATVEAASTVKYQQWPYPDYYIFKNAALRRTHLPAVIVRAPNVVECCRLSQDRGQEHTEGTNLDQECRRLLGNGHFAKVWPSFDLRIRETHAGPPFVGCNSERQAAIGVSSKQLAARIQSHKRAGKSLIH
ncbi:unnamed protein product [Symbiodinium necroappetens]|uniref:Uncharacterized protein n=1 Tax=Symbiodinium necroappetens TaxID=1628268 RepID=A0A812VDA3_9DINO|nr:unnamed protein product [Symbiodinium necroappetens]